MSVVWQVALDEWRYWRRTKLGITVLFVGLVLCLAAVLVNGIALTQTAHDRHELQHAAESRFLEQPDRHPHRMVHYGHYVFRAPAPLSIIEPGVDAYTGTAIFLEGHRQNSAMFADQRQSSGMTRFSSLSPSLLVQVFVPLFIIMIGYASVTREREQGTLNMLIVQGVSVGRFLWGKFLALLAAAALLLLPFAVAGIVAVFNGESFTLSLGFVAGYWVYLLIWCAFVLTVSAIAPKSSVSFAVLITMWLVLCVLLPRLSSSTAAAMVPSMSKLETDFTVIEALSKLGDGHNADDPAFAKLKANILVQYGVNKIDDLPFNYRGMVAQYSETQLTQVLNKYAEQRMETEYEQARMARQFGWLTPMVAVRSFSMMMAGTSLETHHRFLREAEAIRFEFVQALNKAHQDNLDYKTDIDRYSSAESLQAARVDASHWQVLRSFNFQPSSQQQRGFDSLIFVAQLLMWLALVIALLVFAKARVQA